jgi:DNA-binding transcriptional MerR regulator/methylmalonyl-CoA mutase cobalamin-binding subunit
VISQTGLPCSAGCRHPLGARHSLRHQRVILVHPYKALLMDASSPRLPDPITIAAVERDTGLSKDTLRVWERRYGYPAPARDESGERLYSIADVDKLRVVKRLMDQGYRPGKLVGRSVVELQQLAASAAPKAQRAVAAPHAAGGGVEPYVQMLRQHRIEELRRQLSQSLLRVGLAQFVSGVVSPLNEWIGDAWARGELEIYEEHLYTESIQVILRNAITGIPRPGSRPTVVLLTTFPQEAHGLGLLMAEAFFALEGCRCISLGVQTPIPDIVRAALAQNVDIVALSFSDCMNPNQALEGIVELRAKLPRNCEVWAGGSCASLYRRAPDDVLAVTSLNDIGPALALWRNSHRSS